MLIFSGVAKIKGIHLSAYDLCRQTIAFSFVFADKTVTHWIKQWYVNPYVPKTKNQAFVKITLPCPPLN